MPPPEPPRGEPTSPEPADARRRRLGALRVAIEDGTYVLDRRGLAERLARELGLFERRRPDR